MGDKEPRRRKKNRRDSQKKDDVRSEEHFFVLPKSESKDSDQEPEEETVIHSNQPSSVAKIVFVLLFSGLVVSLSFIFISLKDVDRDSAGIFDVGHEDHGAEVHDEHVEGALHDGHSQDHGHDHAHEESEVRIDDFLSGWSSILSLNNEPTKETEHETSSETVEKEIDDLASTTPESSTDQGILEEYVEDITELPSIEIPKESISPEIYPETTTPYSEDEASFSTYEYSEPEAISTPVQPEEEDDDEQMMLDVPPTVATNIEEDNDDDLDSFSVYDKADITNEADYGIRDQLDDLVGILEKESNSDDGNDEDDDIDDDDEQVVDEEFDFWQF